eukprot:c22273_g2_i2 orf=978-1196(+)
MILAGYMMELVSLSLLIKDHILFAIILGACMWKSDYGCKCDLWNCAAKVCDLSFPKVYKRVYGENIHLNMNR